MTFYLNLGYYGPKSRIQQKLRYLIDYGRQNIRFGFFSAANSKKVV